MFAAMNSVKIRPSRSRMSVRISRSDHDLSSGQYRLGKPEQPGGEPGGELARQRTDDLHLVAGGERGVDQFGGERGDLRLALADRLAGEHRLHEHPLLAVARIVLGDHVDLGRRPQRPVAEAGHEHRRSALDVHQVGVARDPPQPVAIVAVHRLVRPHPRPHVVRVALIQLGVEQVGDEAIGSAWRSSSAHRRRPVGSTPTPASVVGRGTG